MPFRDVTGHRTLLALLSRSIAADRLPPSLIFSGPFGVGKRLVAVATAQALNCLRPRLDEADPGGVRAVDACGTCAACRRIARGVHPDVVAVEPNDKGNIRIDTIRDVIDRAAYRPFEGRRRVSIIDQAEALEAGAQNALLKVLEEPPSGSVFLLVTSMPDLLLPTVLSRCPQLRFKPLAAADVVSALVAKGRSGPDIHAVAALANGSIGQALEATSDELNAARHVAAHVLLEAVASDDARRRIEAAKQLVVRTGGPASSERDQLAVHLRAMSSLIRDASMLALCGDRSILANPDLDATLARLASFAGDRGRRAFEAVDQALAALDRYTNAKLVADWLVLRL
jgi:DNA polymerase-3 subunit delta'